MSINNDIRQRSTASLRNVSKIVYMYITLYNDCIYTVLCSLTNTQN